MSLIIINFCWHWARQKNELWFSLLAPCSFYIDPLTTTMTTKKKSWSHATRRKSARDMHKSDFCLFFSSSFSLIHFEFNCAKETCGGKTEKEWKINNKTKITIYNPVPILYMCKCMLYFAQIHANMLSNWKW